MRYLFLCPDRTSASGGIAVIYDMVSFINQQGYDAAVVHNNPSAGYPDYPHPVPAYYTRRMWKAYWRHAGIRKKISMAKERSVVGESRLDALHLAPTDVIVVPEYQLAEAIEAFPEQKLIVFVQNPFSLIKSHSRATERGLNPNKRVSFWCGIADVCQRHLEVLGANNIIYFPVSMKPSEFNFQKIKKRLITYMPRKRPEEAKVIHQSLLSRGKILDYDVKALDGITRREVIESLEESLIFISLLKEEALGFPAAEAMASGCIVVGFDGLGCAEYFNDTTGVPVPEGDLAGIVNSVEQVINEYNRDPARLDELRKYACKLVNKKYSIEEFEGGVASAWSTIDKSLSHADR